MALGFDVWFLLWSGDDGKAEYSVFPVFAAVVALNYPPVAAELEKNRSVNRQFCAICIHLRALVSHQLAVFVQCYPECRCHSRTGGGRSTHQHPCRLDILLERPSSCRLLA